MSGEREPGLDEFTDMDDELDDDDVDRDCYWCNGEGVSECSHPLECTNRHNRFGECRCSGCGGSGLAKDQVIW